MLANSDGGIAERLVHRQPQAEAQVRAAASRTPATAKIYTGNPKPDIAKVTITATFKNGKYKGTATFPKGYACKPANFSREVLRRQPEG